MPNRHLKAFDPNTNIHNSAFKGARIIADGFISLLLSVQAASEIFNYSEMRIYLCVSKAEMRCFLL